MGYRIVTEMPGYEFTAKGARKGVEVLFWLMLVFFPGFELCLLVFLCAMVRRLGDRYGQVYTLQLINRDKRRNSMSINA